MISVIIPTLNEARYIPSTLASLAPFKDRIEVIVVDGGSTDGTVGLCDEHPWVRVTESRAGRAAQMNAGAEIAEGEILLFLHADTQLQGDWPRAVADAAAHDRFGIGAFAFRLEGSRLAYRVLEFGVWARSLFCRLPYGDQALFVHAHAFREIAGYPSIPLMEDVELVRKMRQRGRLVQLRLNATSAPRKWERDGVWNRTFRNWSTYWRYRTGTPPEKLVCYYQGITSALILFCKRPEPGTVKTRLAATVGDTFAVDTYRNLVARTLQVAKARGKEACPIIFYDPPEALDDMRAWLGDEYQYVAQAAGDLGERMQEAFRWAFNEGYAEAVIVGTDCPALASRHVADALATLRENDVVLGPTDDGGYYLIGAKRVHPQLFQGIPWSTDRVFPMTVEAMKAHGITYALLETLRDLDDQSDLEYHQAAGVLEQPAPAGPATAAQIVDTGTVAGAAGPGRE